MFSAIENEKYQAADFIKDDLIFDEIKRAEALAQDSETVKEIISKARLSEGLSTLETAILLCTKDKALEEEIFSCAREVKEKIYGKRIVLFAPLYVSNHCINNCVYCGYKNTNLEMPRRKLSQAELVEEIRILESMGHKRLALEAGEDDHNCPLDYILECIKTIYAQKFDNGSIRRINVNVAATTVAEYKRLKEAEIGTYILFQETYHAETYRKMHPAGPKNNFNWHTTAMHRAMEAGIEDVGLGVLYGLFDYRFDTLAMLHHAEELEKVFGVGPHTVSVPRLREAENVTLQDYPFLVGDQEFKRIVAVLRLALPYAGLILSTREEPSFRDSVISLGVSQISAGSCTGVGGYMDSENQGMKSTAQFEVGDHRSPSEIIKSLCLSGYVPSYCTACYREGRTGERFMNLAKRGQIHNVCLPNALLTFKEYLLDYADDELRTAGENLIQDALESIPLEAARNAAKKKLEKTAAG